MKTLLWIVVLGVLAAGASWYVAGRAAGPALTIESPGKAIGQSRRLAVAIETPGGKLTALEVFVEQGEKRMSLYSLAAAGPKSLVHEGEQLKLVYPIGRKTLPQLEPGTARIVVNAARPVLFGFRQARSSVAREVQVRLRPPIISVLSRFHYINHGGSEMVVYRVSPPDVSSGVRVGEYEYPGYPASGAGIANADPALHVAFFALLWNQDENTPISVYARDEVGNEGHATFDYRVLPRKNHRSRIEITDRFLQKVVPPILANTPELDVDDPNDLVGSFLRINGELRRQNNARIASFGMQTEPRILWQGAFRQLVNTAVEGSFADQRTYYYKDKEIDHQVHLGFDLASTAGATIVAANTGKVVHAGWLGIYGNCVILDHGMGLQSLYAHMSSIEVKVGDMVKQGDTLGHTGSTGLAGGDHLHFTTLLAGNPVNPLDWWSSKWVEDRIVRKLRETGASLTQAAAGSATP